LGMTERAVVGVPQGTPPLAQFLLILLNETALEIHHAHLKEVPANFNAIATWCSRMSKAT